MKIIPAIQGSYILVAWMTIHSAICVGALGVQHFEPGIYFYCGSARGSGGLKARIGHHLRESSRPTWHFDHLKPHMSIGEIWFLSSNEPYECSLVRLLMKMNHASQPVCQLGSRDCRSGCFSHLIHFPLNTNINEIFRSLKMDFDALERSDGNKL